MIKLTPCEFNSVQELTRRLKARKTFIEEYFRKRREPLDKIIQRSIGSNTYRAFRNMPIKPSVVFREWAFSEFGSHKNIKQLTGIMSQREYDTWTDSLSAKFRKTWVNRMGEIMPYGPSRKLPDLFMKVFLDWEELSEYQHRRLMKFLHVPLDSFTLVGIRNCITDPEIPVTATMSFVAGKTMYYQIQNAIRDAAKRVDVPPIFFDVLVWDDLH